MLDNATLSLMAKRHEGAELKRYLEESGVQPGTLSDRMGMKSSSGLYNNYFKVERLGDRAWGNLRAALLSLGLDPRKIRDEPAAVMHREKYVPSEDFRPLVKGWNAEHLRVLKRILSASPVSREMLMIYLETKLEAET